MERAQQVVRELVPRLAEDRVLGNDIESLAGAVRAGSSIEWI